MLSVNPGSPTRGREKEAKGRETYKLNIKCFTNNTNSTNNINNMRNRTRYTKPALSFLELGAGRWHHQQLQGSTRQSRTGLGSGQELGSGMHRSESGSWSQPGQGAGSSSEAGHGWIEQDPCGPPALNWVWCAWHGIPRWSVSVSGHLSCPPLPASATVYDSSPVEPKRSNSDLGCCSNKQGQFLPSICTGSSINL